MGEKKVKRQLGNKLFSSLLAMIVVITTIFANDVTGMAAVKPKLTLSSRQETIAAGKSVQLKVKTVKGLKSKSVTWKSSNTKVAKVSSKGKVTGLKAGNAKITATSKVNKKVKATCKITVKKDAVETIQLDKTACVVVKGKTVKIKIKDVVPTTASSNVTWKVKKSTVAQVSGKGKTAVITGKKAGKTTLTATAADGSKKTASVDIVVVDKKSSIKKVNEIQVTLSQKEVLSGDTLKAKAVVTPSNATLKTVFWSSDNEKVAKIDADGKITAIKAGQVTITAAAQDGSGKKGTVILIVKDKLVPTPTNVPTIEPTIEPTKVPVATPTEVPTISPTTVPTVTEAPKVSPTTVPTVTEAPKVSPTTVPTVTEAPKASPTTVPTVTEAPKVSPTTIPTVTEAPKVSPTTIPTVTEAPKVSPTTVPTVTEAPKVSPTTVPTVTEAPTVSPTTVPTVTEAPKVSPTVVPTVTEAPTISPTTVPTVTEAPKVSPTTVPTVTEAPKVSTTTVPTVTEAPTEIWYESVETAGKAFREEMKKRNSTIELKYKTSEDIKTIANSIPEEALKHTGVATEGDYIERQMGGYHVSMSYYSSGGVTYGTLIYNVTYYTTGEQEAQMDSKIAEVMQELNIDGESDYQKVKKIYDYICSHVTYDDTNLEDESYTLKYTAYAALIDGTSVCQGYANLLYRMLLEAGIDSRIITGTSDNQGHAWNIVKLNDKYYYLDSTWDAERAKAGLEYDYFLKGTTGFDDHVLDTEFESDEFKGEYPISESAYQ